MYQKITEFIHPASFLAAQGEPFSAEPHAPDTAGAVRRLALVADTARELVGEHALLIREAHRRGHQVLCFTSQADPEGARAIQALGGEPMHVSQAGQPNSAVAVKHGIRSLALAFRSLAPDIVMATTLMAGRLGIEAAARVRVPHIVAAFPELALALDGARRDGSAPASAQKPLVRACTTLLSFCHAAVVPGLVRDPVSHGRSLLPAGLDVHFIGGPGVDTARMVHTPLAPLNKGMVFLAIAYPGSERGIAHYCAAARTLSERARAATWLVASPGHVTPSDELIAMLRAHRGVVRYLGPRDEINRLLARAHTVVFPGTYPCLPPEMARALAIGRPVIGAQLPARGLAIQDGVNGASVAADDAGSLADAMAALLRRPDRLPHMAKESRHIARRHFDVWEILATLARALRLDGVEGKAVGAAVGSAPSPAVRHNRA
jgi:glycosyltransferase involved in cell wall biosynthesis